MEVMRLVDKAIELARRKRINQAELARLIGAPPSRLSEWKKDEGRPSIDQAFRMARALGTTLDYLADDEQDDPAGPALTEEERTVLLMVRTLGTEEAIRRLMRPAGSGGVGAELGGEEIVAIRDLTPPPGRKSSSKVVRPHHKDEGSDLEDLPGRVKR